METAKRLKTGTGDQGKGMDIYPAIDLKGGKCVRLTHGRFE